MLLPLSAGDTVFRDEVRAFLDLHLTEDLRAEGRACSGIYAEYPAARRWHGILAEKGWSVPRWPVEYGGTGWTPLQHYIFASELVKADAPVIGPNATGMVGPVIIAYGTETQKQFYLPRIRSGEDWWAQGYSEPEAGSDLAGLTCSAERDGEHYIVNGSKIWTTHAHYSNRIFCLVRTARGGKPQEGISFLLIDLDTPGILIRPILSISGQHELNQVYFTDVRVPCANLIGQENDGWAVAKYLLLHERSNPRAPGLRERLERLRQRVSQARGDSRDAYVLRMADLDTELTALEIGELRRAMPELNDGGTGAVTSVYKVIGTEMRQRIDELALELEGSAALLSQQQDAALSDLGLAFGAQIASIYLHDRAASIYAGTNEIQRDIIARSILGTQRYPAKIPYQLTAEQILLRDNLDDFFPKIGDMAVTKAWQACGREIGITGLGLPESCGGVESDHVDTIVVMISVGTHALALPFLEAGVTARTVLAEQPVDRFGALLSTVASGDAIVIPAWGSLHGDVQPSEDAVLAELVSGGWRLHGRQSRILGAPCASHFIIGARATTDGEPMLFLVAKNLKGMMLESFKTLDGRGMSSLVCTALEVDDRDRLVLSGSPVDVLERAENAAIEAAAAEALGLCEAMMEQTIRYTADRRQFGKPLSDFQVLRHRMADMHLHIEQLRSILWLVTYPVDGPPKARRRTLSMAKVLTDRALRFVSHNAMQLHGGIGMTDELPLARYVRRAMALQLSLDGTEHHRRRVATFSIGAQPA